MFYCQFAGVSFRCSKWKRKQNISSFSLKSVSWLETSKNMSNNFPAKWAWVIRSKSVKPEQQLNIRGEPIFPQVIWKIGECIHVKGTSTDPHLIIKTISSFFASVCVSLSSRESKNWIRYIFVLTNVMEFELKYNICNMKVATIKQLLTVLTLLWKYVTQASLIPSRCDGLLNIHKS